jgi:hypothetical protein
MHPKRLDNPNAKRPKAKDKQLDAMVERAWKAGWWCRYAGSGHVVCYPPDEGRMVDVANTPSDHRTVPNTRSYFRRAGLDL